VLAPEVLEARNLDIGEVAPQFPPKVGKVLLHHARKGYARGEISMTQGYRGAGFKGRGPVLRGHGAGSKGPGGEL
jgi:hypothetical protein